VVWCVWCCRCRGDCDVWAGRPWLRRSAIPSVRRWSHLHWPLHQLLSVWAACLTTEVGATGDVAGNWILVLITLRLCGCFTCAQVQQVHEAEVASLHEQHTQAITTLQTKIDALVSLWAVPICTCDARYW
jgi:hypothetical protein